jgi:hypothetical protein
MLAAGGLVLTLAESLLPRSAARSAARAAIGLLFLELLACSVIGIFR